MAMLRVYCSWPGVSAMMNLRRWRGEVAVGDVDGDALLALGAQAVGELGEVDGGLLLAGRGDLAGDGADLVLVDVAGVVEQAADEGGLAVVDAAGGGEAEQVLGLLDGEELFDGEVGFVGCLVVGLGLRLRMFDIRSSPRAS